MNTVQIHKFKLVGHINIQQPLNNVANIKRG